MISFFWKKGYYFNQYFINYSPTLNLYNFINYHYSVFCLFLKIIILRADCKMLLTNKIKSNIILNRLGILGYSKHIFLINQLDFFKFVFNLLIVTTFPVLINLKLSEVFNLIIYYLTRTYRGVSLSLNKPLFRRTRGRTYTPAKRKLKMMNPLLKNWWGVDK